MVSRRCRLLVRVGPDCGVQLDPEFLSLAGRVNLGWNFDCDLLGLCLQTLHPASCLRSAPGFRAVVRVARVVARDPAIWGSVRTPLQRSQVAPPCSLTICFSSSRPCRWSRASSPIDRVPKKTNLDE